MICSMPRFLLSFPLSMVFALTLFGQQPSNRAEFEMLLQFKGQHDGDSPGGWFTNPPGTVSVDSKIVHGGEWSARLERDSKSAGTFSVVTQGIDWSVSGANVELRGFLRLDQSQQGRRLVVARGWRVGNAGAR